MTCRDTAGTVRRQTGMRRMCNKGHILSNTMCIGSDHDTVSLAPYAKAMIQIRYDENASEVKQPVRLHIVYSIL